MKRLRTINEPFDPPKHLRKRANKQRQIAVWRLEAPLFDATDCRFVVCERRATWMALDRKGYEIPVCTRHAMQVFRGEMRDEEREHEEQVKARLARIMEKVRRTRRKA